MLTISNSEPSHSFIASARDAMRGLLRDGALHRMMIDAGNLQQRIEAGLPIFPVLDFGEVDGVIEFSDRPAELDMPRLGGGGNRSEQGGSNDTTND